eukprot:GHVT01072534.1.p1 GENE.GHVT01072534.1~~GHVT01072534.1.p1  ORF type:complete len:232 (+),score=22.71 GHVT01072534.1:1238-1933(+)
MSAPLPLAATRMSGSVGYGGPPAPYQQEAMGDAQRHSAYAAQGNQLPAYASGNHYPMTQPVAPAVYGAQNPPIYGEGGGDVEANDGDAKQITPDMPTYIRHAFVRKVLGILTIQILVMFAFAACFSLIDSWRLWLSEYAWLPLVFLFVGFIAICVVVCNPKLGRRVPLNFFLLSFITFCISWLVALGAASTSVDSFFLAIGITLVITVALTLFACQSRWDFTGKKRPMPPK